MANTLLEKMVERVEERASSEDTVVTEGMAAGIKRVLDLVPEALGARVVYEEHAWFSDPPPDSEPAAVVQVVTAKVLFEAIVPIEDVRTVWLAWLPIEGRVISVKHQRGRVICELVFCEKDRTVISDANDADDQGFIGALARQLWDLLSPPDSAQAEGI